MSSVLLEIRSVRFKKLLTGLMVCLKSRGRFVSLFVVRIYEGTQLVFIRYGIDGSRYFEPTDTNLARGDREGRRGLVFRNEQPTDTWSVGFGRASRDFGLPR